ncbi:NUDIX hydrolase [Candidatus Leptofilum sp.]|uniref:NUDIX hydrolase n=1 Tax=Candidatus Leptofilum sp. TaxID=3241576 RepID=UPI003B59BF2A
MEITRHFTSTTFVVYKDRVLLHQHKKCGTWLPAGGHIDRDELPEEAAVREVKEETGLDVILYNPDVQLFIADEEACQLHRPMYLMLENINPYHQHVDFIYYATAVSNQLNPANGETNRLKWFDQTDLENTEMPTNVQVCAQEALALLGQKD